MEDNESTPKITSVVKTERVKDPRRVVQGKKLAEISRQAKERKAKEREANVRKEERDKRKSFLQINYSFALIPVILFGGYYFFYLRKKPEEEESEELRMKTIRPDDESETVMKTEDIEDDDDCKQPDLECL